MRSVFHKALDQPHELRPEYVAELCGDDVSMRRSVLDLLHHDGTDGPGYPDSHTPVGPPDAAAGDRFGPYRLVSELGAGGMGRVFLAERADGAYEKQVALKFVRRDVSSPSALDRFLAERRMLGRLQHSNIATLLDGGVSDSGIPYLVMEYVQGSSITTYADRHRLTVRQRVELFSHVCAAVQHAHQQLVIHRDLKPGNILVTDQGEVKLLDFGIAKLVEEDSGDSEPATVPGTRMLTPEYASPEQLHGDDVTTASDVYALGIVLYELVIGRRPFSFGSRSLAEIERMVMDERPRRPSTVLAPTQASTSGEAQVSRLRSTEPHRLWRQVRGDLDTIVLKCLNKEPDRRYPTAAALREDLERWLDGRPVNAQPDSAAYRVRKFVGRHRVGVGVTLAGAVALASFATLYTTGVRAERDRVRAEAAKAERVIAFLQGVLRSPRPELAGRDVTVFEVMEDLTASIQTTLVDQPQVEAVLRATIGYTYQGLGLYERAHQEVARALSLLESDAATAPARLAQALGDLARLEHDRAVFDSARANYERAITLYRDKAPDDPGLDNTLNDFATLLTQQGQLAQSLAAFAEVLARTRDRYGAEHPEVAQVLTNMASTSLRLGQADRAQDYLRQAIAIYAAHPGTEYPLSITLNNLAYTRLESGDLEAADSLFRWSLGLRRQLHGERHAQVALAMHGLASQLLFARGRFTEAETMLLEALDIYREVYPEGHVYTSVSLTSLGKVRLAEGRLTEAEASLWQALSIQERLLPEDHAFTSHTRSLLGEALRRQGRVGEAEPLLRRGLAGLEAGERNDMAREIDRTRRELVALFDSTGRPELADPYR